MDRMRRRAHETQQNRLMQGSSKQTLEPQSGTGGYLRLCEKATFGGIRSDGAQSVRVMPTFSSDLSRVLEHQPRTKFWKKALTGEAVAEWANLKHHDFGHTEQQSLCFPYSVYDSNMAALAEISNSIPGPVKRNSDFSTNDEVDWSRSFRKLKDDASIESCGVQNSMLSDVPIGIRYRFLLKELKYFIEDLGQNDSTFDVSDSSSPVIPNAFVQDVLSTRDTHPKVVLPRRALKIQTDGFGVPGGRAVFHRQVNDWKQLQENVKSILSKKNGKVDSHSSTRNLRKFLESKRSTKTSTSARSYFRQQSKFLNKIRKSNGKSTYDGTSKNSSKSSTPGDEGVLYDRSPNAEMWLPVKNKLPSRKSPKIYIELKDSSVKAKLKSDLPNAKTSWQEKSKLKPGSNIEKKKLAKNISLGIDVHHLDRSPDKFNFDSILQIGSKPHFDPNPRKSFTELTSPVGRKYFFDRIPGAGEISSFMREQPYFDRYTCEFPAAEKSIMSIKTKFERTPRTKLFTPPDRRKPYFDRSPDSIKVAALMKDNFDSGRVPDFTKQWSAVISKSLYDEDRSSAETTSPESKLTFLNSLGKRTVLLKDSYEFVKKPSKFTSEITNLAELGTAKPDQNPHTKTVISPSLRKFHIAQDHDECAVKPDMIATGKSQSKRIIREVPLISPLTSKPPGVRSKVDFIKKSQSALNESRHGQSLKTFQQPQKKLFQSTAHPRKKISTLPPDLLRFKVNPTSPLQVASTPTTRNFTLINAENEASRSSTDDSQFMEAFKEKVNSQTVPFFSSIHSKVDKNFSPTRTFRHHNTPSPNLSVVTECSSKQSDDHSPTTSKVNNLSPSSSPANILSKPLRKLEKGADAEISKMQLSLSARQIGTEEKPRSPLRSCSPFSRDAHASPSGSDKIIAKPPGSYNPSWSFEPFSAESDSSVSQSSLPESDRLARKAEEKNKIALKRHISAFRPDSDNDSDETRSSGVLESPSASDSNMSPSVKKTNSGRLRQPAKSKIRVRLMIRKP